MPQKDVMEWGGGVNGVDVLEPKQFPKVKKAMWGEEHTAGGNGGGWFVVATAELREKLANKTRNVWWPATASGFRIWQFWVCVGGEELFEGPKRGPRSTVANWPWNEQRLEAFTSALSLLGPPQKLSRPSNSREEKAGRRASKTIGTRSGFDWCCCPTHWRRGENIRLRAEHTPISKLLRFCFASGWKAGQWDG